MLEGSGKSIYKPVSSAVQVVDSSESIHFVTVRTEGGCGRDAVRGSRGSYSSGLQDKGQDSVNQFIDGHCIFYNSFIVI